MPNSCLMFDILFDYKNGTKSPEHNKIATKIYEFEEICCFDISAETSFARCKLDYEPIHRKGKR